MSGKNIILLILIYILMATGFVLMACFIKRERELYKRSKINYNNYYEYKKYFELKISWKVVLFAAAYACAVIVVSCLLISNDALIPYILLMVAELCLDGLGFYTYVSTTKYNRDFGIYDDFHKNIESSYNNKSKVIGNIDLINAKRQEVENEVNKLYSKLGALIIDFKALDNIQECYSPFEKLLKEQEVILNSFDDKMPNMFTDSLIEYLKNGGVANANTYIFNPNMELDIDSVVATIASKLKHQYISCVQNAFNNLKHKNANALLEMVDILKGFNLFEAKHIKVLLGIVNKKPKENDCIIRYLFANKFINFEIISECVKNKNDWIFDYPLAPHISNNDYTSLVAEVVKINSLNITNKLLMFADKSSSNLIKNGISIAAVDNESSILMQRYLELLELDGSFSSTATKYENIALTLKAHYRSIQNSNHNIETIVENGTFYENKKLLDETYSKVLSSIEPVLLKTFRTMLYFTLYCSNKFNYFFQTKINSLYVEYKRKLNVKGLMCLTSLLDAVMFTMVSDAKAISLINANVDTLKNNQQFDSYYPMTNNKVRNTRLYGKDLIQNLFKNHKNDLSTIVNHIESERLVLDKIRFL